MKILSVLGSPRKKGNTATVLAWMEAALTEAGHEVERINIASHKLNGCLSCYKCQMNPDAFECVQKDEANTIYTKMVKADGVILSSPLYWWSITAQLKPLWDRFMCQMKGLPPKQKSSLKGKPMAFMMTCWGPVENNSEATVSMAKQTFEYLLVDHRGALIVPGCDPQGAPGSAYQDQARKLALKLVA